MLEVLLIFIGVTLAIAFGNWNTERLARAEERATLEDLRSNLRDNVGVLESGIAFDTSTLEAIDTVLARLARRAPYTEDLGSAFDILENFDSPFLVSSAYETLRSDGLSLISSSDLREQIVQLFEGSYAFLISDVDRTEWINYEVVMLPLVLRYVEDLPGDGARPVAYEALFGDSPFRLALLRTRNLRTSAVDVKRRALGATHELILAIDRQLVM